MSQHMTIEDMLKQTLEGIDELRTKLQLVEIVVPVPQVVTVNDIAKVEGVSFSHINTKARYLLPRYGESAFPDGHRRWPLEEYLAWRRKPLEERINGYEEMLESIKESCVENAIEKEKKRA